MLDLLAPQDLYATVYCNHPVGQGNRAQHNKS